MTRKILMVNKYYPPHIGGVEFHVKDLATGLVATGEAEVTVLVVGNSDQRVEEVVDGVRVIRLPRAFEYASTPVSWSFRKELKTWAKWADIVHFHFPYPYGEFCSLGMDLGKPIVVTYHTDIVRQKKLLALYRPFLNRFLNKADAIVASSPNMIAHSEFLAARPEKTHHIDFGLPVENFIETPASAARAAELRAPFNDKKIVLFIGRLVYYKGVAVLLEAFKDVDPSAHLVIIGTGPLEEELKHQATELDIGDRVSFLPPVNFEDLVAWYQAADLFVLPSVERSEAFGLVQIEAHASKTPVISTNLTTGVPYANLDGQTGIVVPVGDARALGGAIDRLVTDDSLRETYAATAYERAFREFTIPLMCERMLELYDEIEGVASGDTPRNATHAEENTTR